jgi:large subunit ribosomal protein L10
MKSKDEKKKIVEELKEALADARNAYFFDYRGIQVGPVNQLRRKIEASESFYRVEKNTLIGHAVAGTEKEELGKDLEGMTAIAYSKEDPVALAKVLTEFAKEHPTFTFKTGMVQGRVITGDQLKEIASMPGREELLSKLVFLLQSPIRRLATALAGPSRNLATVLSQVAENKDE